LRGADLNDPDAAIAAFESSMRSYALAGDAMHVNNARYMMASTAAEAGRHTDRAMQWAQQCVEYGHASGHRHELAHAVLTRAVLSTRPDVDAELFDAVDTFRAVGDLRCLTRSYLHLAAHRPVAEQAPPLQQALDVARRAHDIANQATALERLVAAQWESGAHREAALALGALANLVGYEPAVRRCPQAMVGQLDQWDIAIAEGQAGAPQPHRPTDQTA
jgi:hypothetical protein